MQARYERNLFALSAKESESLGNKTVCVIGCGGLGGYQIEMLARIGVGRIKAVDCDVFCESNLNRQLFSNEQNLGLPKSDEAKKRISAVNSATEVISLNMPLTSENAEEILLGCDVAVDALDNIPSRILLQNSCERTGIPMVHGGIGGWCGQVTTVLPGERTLSLLFSDDAEGGVTERLGNLPFVAAFIASVQCAEVIKLLTGKGEILSNKLFTVDLLQNETELISLL